MNELIFACAGGNRNPNAADWSQDGVLAFGAGNNIALWRPHLTSNEAPKSASSSDSSEKVHRGRFGISHLLAGHTDAVNAVKYVATRKKSNAPLLVTGSADKTIRIWHNVQEGVSEVVPAHTSSVLSIASADGFDGFVSGSADGTVKIWSFGGDDGSGTVEARQTIELKPKFLPLAIAVHCIENSWILAIAGTRTSIQIYVSEDGHFNLASTLTGHEGWVRSLAFTTETSEDRSDLLLASASQDKYVRLWRIRQGQEPPLLSPAKNSLDNAMGSVSLSNKAHLIRVGKSKVTYSLTFEALLLGHEDWVYTARWSRSKARLQLLTASADNSLTVWEPDEASGVWLSTARLGEVSAQKGATTATGSTGGFWVGLWSPDEQAVACLGRTGSWRLWSREADEAQWKQEVAVTGHIKGVKSLAWSPNGDYLLSTGSDQTTRLFAAQRSSDSVVSWHEFSRPQIHGYDLNCIDTISESRFISGADEKLLRVFDEPQSVAELLNHACNIEVSAARSMPDAANIPVLGLSNKAITTVREDANDQEDNVGEEDVAADAGVQERTMLDLDRPPFEDQLARHMLWPECEKLYGHGYEVSAVTASHDGSLVATACKASSIDHAVIRLYETREWREIKSPLKAHSLTIHNLAFSRDDQYLLSVGRDRQWTIFKRCAEQSTDYQQVAVDPKGHSRMILDCAWAPQHISSLYTFATAGRDKLIKIWTLQGDEVALQATVTADSPVTSIGFLDHIVDHEFLLAFGTETGSIKFLSINKSDMDTRRELAIRQALLPSAAVTRLTWRPSCQSRPNTSGSREIAVASDDHSLRIFEVHV